MTYQHTQFSPIVAVIFGGFGILAFALMFITRFSWIAVLSFLILLLCLIIFNSLTIEVGQGRVDIHFGLDLLHKKILLADIDNVRVIKAPQVGGLGVQWSNGAWVYNSYGSGAVEISVKSGECVVIGSEEPEKLASAIENSLMK